MAQGEGVGGEWPTAARLGDIRRRRSAWRSFDGWNGLVFETGRLIVFVEIGLECKGFIASFAIEVFESRMGLHVSTKIGPDTEKRFIRTQSATT